jgi:hypothetical protein
MLVDDQVAHPAGRWRRFVGRLRRLGRMSDAELVARLERLARLSAQAEKDDVDPEVVAQVKAVHEKGLALLAKRRKRFGVEFGRQGFRAGFSEPDVAIAVKTERAARRPTTCAQRPRSRAPQHRSP